MFCNRLALFTTCPASQQSSQPIATYYGKLTSIAQGFFHSFNTALPTFSAKQRSFTKAITIGFGVILASEIGALLYFRAKSTVDGEATGENSMKKTLLGLLCITSTVVSNETNITRYLQCLSSYENFGSKGNWNEGEMQLIDNYEEIIAAEGRYQQEFLDKGLNAEEAKRCSKMGVILEDKRWLWVRDPLILPNGKTTAYNRFISTNGLNGAPGVSVMAISEEKQVLVNVIFRHATRAWEIELPRGGREKNESSEEAAIRELEEETGFHATSATKIGSIASDSGILSNVLDICLVSDCSFTKIAREDCEAILHCTYLPKETIKKGFCDGYIELSIGSKEMKINCRDPFLASAILICEQKTVL